MEQEVNKFLRNRNPTEEDFIGARERLEELRDKAWSAYNNAEISENVIDGYINRLDNNYDDYLLRMQRHFNP